jgi:hypothetical protein
VQPAPLLPAPLLPAPPSLDETSESAGPRRWGADDAASLWRVRAGRTILWVLIALAAAGGLRSLRMGPSTGASGTGAATLASDAGGFAQSFVGTYLAAGAGQESSLRAFYPGPVNLAGVGPATRYVARTAVVSTQALTRGYWAITVAADVLAQAPGGYQDQGTSYYRTGIARSGASFVATSLPSLVPAPAPGPPPRLATPVPSAGAGGPADPAVTQYLDAYLTGQGEPGPPAGGTPVPPLSPSPFVSATVVALSLGATRGGPGGRRTRLAEVEVSGTDGAGREEILGYTLSLATPVGHGQPWTVQAILPAPALLAAPAAAPP